MTGAAGGLSGPVGAIIPARGGSKGVPGKNLRLIGGAPLVARAARAAIEAGLDRVAVSTDSDEIAAAAERCGASVIRRPAEISGDSATSESALTHALETWRAEGFEPEAFLMLQCTSPFIEAEHVRLTLAKIEEGFDSALSVSEEHGFLWSEGADGAAIGVNHDHRTQRQRRQDRPAQYRETGAIYAMRTSAFRASGNRFCGRTALALIDAPALEIDTFEDLSIAEAIMAARGSKE